MTGRTHNRNPILITRVRLFWYLPALAVILALGYAALLNILPSWILMLVLFAAFMWLFSLGFALYAELLRFLKERKEPRP